MKTGCQNERNCSVDVLCFSPTKLPHPSHRLQNGWVSDAIGDKWIIGLLHDRQIGVVLTDHPSRPDIQVAARQKQFCHRGWKIVARLRKSSDQSIRTRFLKSFEKSVEVAGVARIETQIARHRHKRFAALFVARPINRTDLDGICKWVILGHASDNGNSDIFITAANAPSVPPILKNSPGCVGVAKMQREDGAGHVGILHERSTMPASLVPEVQLNGRQNAPVSVFEILWLGKF